VERLSRLGTSLAAAHSLVEPDWGRLAGAADRVPGLIDRVPGLIGGLLSVVYREPGLDGLVD